MVFFTKENTLPLIHVRKETTRLCDVTKANTLVIGVTVVNVSRWHHDRETLPYDLKMAGIPPLTLLLREMRSADSRMATLLEVCDLSISSPPVYRSLWAMYAADSFTRASSVSDNPLANSWLGLKSRAVECRYKEWVIRSKCTEFREADKHSVPMSCGWELITCLWR